MRAMFDEAFRPTRIKAMDPFVEETANKLVDAFIDAGHCARGDDGGHLRRWVGDDDECAFGGCDAFDPESGSVGALEVQP